MTKDELKEVLASHQRWLTGDPNGKRADLCNADLRCAELSDANLRVANLCYADLRGANLRVANLCYANLRGANLSVANLSYAELNDANLGGANLGGANLSVANLRDANLRGANLRGANLRGVNLRSAELNGADLSGADLDYSAWPLRCNSLEVKIDKRIAAQLLYHALCAMQSCADEPDVAAVLASEPCLKLANQFHRVDECGRIKPLTEGGVK